uniref:Tf2-1-like SH3-like domain-containing protein n=1 Tax=Ananas comosus var. bracteatus TaxID=296719 RepID=A0A6V7NWX7_ANACO|nr:unnamed protein product [Ananas comosus var. bracteatus]
MIRITHDDLGLETDRYACMPLCSFAHTCEGRSPQVGTPEIAIATHALPCGIGRRNGMPWGRLIPSVGMLTTTGPLGTAQAGLPTVLERIGAVAYQLALPPKLADVHNVFHVSNLRKYIHNPDHAMLYKPPELHEDLSYEEFPVSIIAWEVRKLRNREIPYVKIRWSNHDDREATWELEEVMKAHHPHLFEEMS